MGVSCLLFGIALWSSSRRRELAALSVLPLIVVWFPLLPGWLRSLRNSAGEPLLAPLARFQNVGALVPCLALVPALLLFAISFRLSLTASRAYLLFVPYLIMLVAAGTFRLSQRPPVAVALAVFLAAVFGTSVWKSKLTPNSSRDYQGLAQELNAKLRSGDLIFVAPRSWWQTPLYYYIDQKRVVAENYEQALQRTPGTRVWVIEAPGTSHSTALSSALAPLVPIDSVQAHMISAVAFERAPYSKAATIHPD